MTPAEQYRTLIDRLQVLAEVEKMPSPKNGTVSGYYTGEEFGGRTLQRATNILNKMRVLSGQDRGILQVIKIEVGFSGITAHLQPAVSTSPNRIWLNPWVFDTAPDSVLAFVIAHEVGHLIQRSRGMINRVPLSSVSANPHYAYEYDADERAANMALKLGYSKAEAWKWLQDMQQYSEVTAPDNPEKPVGMLSSKTGKEVFTPYSKDNDTHPSFKARAERVNKKVPGFTLSQLDQVEQAIQSA